MQLMMETKVHMVRDAQCAEKDAIKKELSAEEKRLDDEMEVDRVNAIRIEEEIARKRKNERMIGAMMIMDQIKHNQQVCDHVGAPICVAAWRSGSVAVLDQRS